MARRAHSMVAAVSLVHAGCTVGCGTTNASNANATSGTDAGTSDGEGRDASGDGGDVASSDGATQWATFDKGKIAVFRGQFVPSVGDYLPAGDPTVIHDGPTYRLMFTCLDDSGKHPAICQRTSTDGTTWTTAPAGKSTIIEGLMLVPNAAGWDGNHETSFLQKVGGELRLFYAGYSGAGGNWINVPSQLALATSSDGEHFVPMKSAGTPPEVVMRPDPAGNDRGSMFSPSIVDHEGMSWMVYSGFCFSGCPSATGVAIYGAKSKDGGRTWIKEPKPVFAATEVYPWAAHGVGEPELVRGGDGFFYLFISGGFGDKERHVVAIARGKTPFGDTVGVWQVNPAPVLSPSGTKASFDACGSFAPSVIVEGGRTRVWFMGFDDCNGTCVDCQCASCAQHAAIGYAEAAGPLFQLLTAPDAGYR